MSTSEAGARAWLEPGALVWFYVPAGGQHVGLVAYATARGARSVDVIWEKSCDTFTVCRVPVEDVTAEVRYTTFKRLAAVRKICRKIRTRGGGSTRSAIKAAALALAAAEINHDRRLA